MTAARHFPSPAASPRRRERKRGRLAVVLACAALTYGGVSLFVVAFAVFPVADASFQQAAVPHRRIPAAIALGAFYLHDDGPSGQAPPPSRTPSRWRIPAPRCSRCRVLSVLASAIIPGVSASGWLAAIEFRARLASEGHGSETSRNCR